MFTQVNLTSLQLVQSRQDIDLLKMPKGFSVHDVATTMDSLLTFYDAIKVHHMDKGNCNWNGRKRITNVLPKVFISIKIMKYCRIFGVNLTCTPPSRPGKGYSPCPDLGRGTPYPVQVPPQTVIYKFRHR